MLSSMLLTDGVSGVIDKADELPLLEMDPDIESGENVSPPDRRMPGVGKTMLLGLFEGVD